MNKSYGTVNNFAVANDFYLCILKKDDSLIEMLGVL